MRAKPERRSEAAAHGVDDCPVRCRRRAAPKPVEQYYIEFRSRYAMSYGHSFVVFGRGAPGKKIDPKQIAGLHPASDSQLPWFIGHVVPVTSETGASEGDTEEKYVSARYRVMLNKAEYDKVVGFIRKLQKNSPVWHAEIYNCNAFVADIAKFVGLKTPTTMVFPKEFITQLRELNRGTRGAITGRPPRRLRCRRHRSSDGTRRRRPRLP